MRRHDTDHRSKAFVRILEGRLREDYRKTTCHFLSFPFPFHFQLAFRLVVNLPFSSWYLLFVVFCSFNILAAVSETHGTSMSTPSR